MIDCGSCFCHIDNDGLGYGVCEFDGVEKKCGHVCDLEEDAPNFAIDGADMRTGKKQ